MNKLVSKNPILRFKEGRKIMKYLNTPGPLPYIKTGKVGNYNIYSNDGGKTFVKADRWTDYDPNNHINSDGSLEGFSSYVPERSRYAMFNGTKYERGNGGYYDITNTKNPVFYKEEDLPFNFVLDKTGTRWRTMAKTPVKNSAVSGKTKIDLKEDTKILNLLNNLSKNRKTLNPTRFISTYDDGTWAANANQEGLTNRDLVRAFLRDVLKMGEASDGIWGKNTEDAYLKYLASKQTTPTNSYTPGIEKNNIFTPTRETTTDFNVAKEYLTPKQETTTFNLGTYVGDPTRTYNVGNIRANRGNLYSNVDEYWDYLSNNKNSDDFQLFLNIMGTLDGNLNRGAFDAAMAKYGISGNLGRRDSGRLANLLNDLRAIGTEGSDARNAFLNSYKLSFDNVQTGTGNTIYDRSATRDWLRNNAGGSAYAFTGELRKAVRNILNGLGTDQDKELIKGNADLTKALTGYFKIGGTMNILPSRNIVERFKNGRKIDFFLGGGIKRFKVSYKTRTGGDWLKKEFNTQEEVNAFRKRLSHVPVFKVDDMKGASENSVVKSSRVKGKDAATTSYDRQLAEKYNHLSREEAYKEAQKSGKNFFAYLGKVYKTDLKNGENNIDEMIAMYGNNLGWDNHPKLQTKQSREARKLYRSQLGAKTLEIRVTMPNVNALGIRKGNAFQLNISYNVPNGAIEYTGEDGKLYWMRQNHSTGEFVFGDRNLPISYAKTPVPEGYIIPGTNIKISKGLNIGGLNLLKKWF